MKFEPDQLYHLYNRGINSQRIYYNQKNYILFLKKFRDYCIPYCRVVTYCLMPTHFHFLIQAKSISVEELKSLNQKIGVLLSSYAQAINKQQNRSGSLFEASTEAKLIEDNNCYPEVCMHYIHQNPLKAGLVEKLSDWKFSSYPDYIGIRNGTLPDIKFTYRWLGINSSEQFIVISEKSIDPELIKKVKI